MLPAADRRLRRRRTNIWQSGDVPCAHRGDLAPFDRFRALTAARDVGSAPGSSPLRSRPVHPRTSGNAGGSLAAQRRRKSGRSAVEGPRSAGVFACRIACVPLAPASLRLRATRVLPPRGSRRDALRYGKPEAHATGAAGDSTGSFDCVPSRLRPHVTPLRMTGGGTRHRCSAKSHAPVRGSRRRGWLPH